jgi:hypothetical protein
MHHREYVSMIRQEIESLAHPHGVVYQEVYDEEEPIALTLSCETGIANFG